ncbi:hypothetical protein Tco_0824529 [Tanacetum coccineum]|uniref:Uncharacterized protein n=1 Tax=Tanacetum coccineum TaxID=301880 RepID=A0ABQ5AL46_9ASTR
MKTIDWTKEFDAEPTAFCYDALTDVKQVIGAWSLMQNHCTLDKMTASRPDIMFAVCLCADFKSLQRFLTYMLSKGYLVRIFGTLLLHLRECRIDCCDVDAYEEIFLQDCKNADFYQIIDYLTGCSINYSLLVDPDLIGPWLQQFWTTASLRVINDVPHIRAMVAGKKILISEETIRADLLFDDRGKRVDCFPQQVIGGQNTKYKTHIDISYEGCSRYQPLLKVALKQVIPKVLLTSNGSTDNSQGLASLQVTTSTLGTASYKLGVSRSKPFLNLYNSQAQGQAQEYCPNSYTSVSKHSMLLVESQNLKKQKRRRKKQRKKVSSVKMGRNKEEEVLERKSDDTEEINIREKRASNVKSGDTEELDCGYRLKSPRKLQRIEVARKIQAEWDAEEEGKRFEELKKAKPKTTLRVKPTSLAQERNKMMNFLKNQGYKNLQKLKAPRRKGCVQERNAKRLSRKRKATISEEQPFKKLKLRTETVDEIRNYLRVVDFEKCAQERESLEGLSTMITEFRQDLSHHIEFVQRINMSTFPQLFRLDTSRDHTTIWETPKQCDDFWKKPRRLEKSELMILGVGTRMEVEDENETTIIHDTSVSFLWTTKMVEFLNNW